VTGLSSLSVCLHNVSRENSTLHYKYTTTTTTNTTATTTTTTTTTSSSSSSSNSSSTLKMPHLPVYLLGIL